MKFLIDLPGKDNWSHLVSDDLKILHSFMRKMKISISRFHKGKNLPHYDIKKTEFEKIINNENYKIEIVSSKEIVKFLRNNYGDKKI